MSLVVNHNLMAANVANNLSSHYGNLATSTQRLSTGLRINSAADDAAGLAIRELMRADIATLHQGARNANDAISLIQTADGALAVIDEKLIRMKELAEQAATGTYDSVQRLMIDSEFQQMASEIDRIANATDFNGIHLLNGNLSGAHNGSGLTSTGAMKIHFGSGNDSAEDYYYINIGSCRINSLFNTTTSNSKKTVIPVDWPGVQIIDGKYVLHVSHHNAGDDTSDVRYLADGLDMYKIPSGLKNVTIKSVNSEACAHKPHVSLFTKDGYQLTGYDPGGTYYTNQGGTTYSNPGYLWWNNGISTGQDIIDKWEGSLFDSGSTYHNEKLINNANEQTSHKGITVTLKTNQSEDGYNIPKGNIEEIHIDEVKDNLVFIIGGHSKSLGGANCYIYDLEITCDTGEEVVESTEGMMPSISTQEAAQKMLTEIDKAIVSKDKIRAHLGAMQNRLENTITNITTQAENLQASESRISDVDVATEMTNFVRNQILAQSAVAMLSQANSMPQMAMQLIG